MPISRPIRLLLPALLLTAGGMYYATSRRPRATPPAASPEDQPPPPRPRPALAPSGLAPDAREPPPAPPAADAVQAAATVESLAALFSSGAAWADIEAKVGELEGRLAALGRPAGKALLARYLRHDNPPGLREKLFDLLRRQPGPEVDNLIMAEARGAQEPAIATMALEALGQRRSPAGIALLETLAREDHGAPGEAVLAAGPRDPSDPSTDLPDTGDLTPRLQAVAALGASDDPRAGVVLADILRNSVDESARLAAAKHLQDRRTDPTVNKALRLAAAGDPSPYVRLAALHSLEGSADPTLAPVLAQIAAGDRDAGVRALAAALLKALPGAP